MNRGKRRRAEFYSRQFKQIFQPAFDFRLHRTERRDTSYRRSRHAQRRPEPSPDGPHIPEPCALPPDDRSREYRLRTQGAGSTQRRTPEGGRSIAYAAIAGTSSEGGQEKPFHGKFISTCEETPVSAFTVSEEGKSLEDRIWVSFGIPI